MSSNQHHSNGPIPAPPPTNSVVSPRASWNNSNPALTPETNKCVSTSSKLRESIRSSKRRLIQQLLVKLKQAEASDDNEYRMLRARQLELHESILRIMTHVKSYVTNLVALGYQTSLIGECSNNIANPTLASHSAARKQTKKPGLSISPNHTLDKPSSPVATMVSSGGTNPIEVAFSKGMGRIDATARELAGTVLTEVVAAIQKKLDAMITLKKEMEDRENLKLDFDSAVRKLRIAKEKGQPEKVVRRDIKLQAARHALHVATEAIVKKFQFYESARSTLIAHEMQQFRDLQVKFFCFCATTFQVGSVSGDGDNNQSFVVHEEDVVIKLVASSNQH